MKNNMEDKFSEGLLKTLNSIYEKFSLIDIVGSIYVIGYDKKSYTAAIPKEGGDMAFCYPEKDIIFVDKNCITPFSKCYLESLGKWYDWYNEPEILKGHTAGCEIFNAIVQSKLSQGKTP